MQILPFTLPDSHSHIRREIKAGISPPSYIVFYHNDFDGLASACLFSLRALSALKLHRDRVFYRPIDYGQTFDYNFLLEIVRRKHPDSSLEFIFLDFNMGVLSLDDIVKDCPLDSLYMCIDHHDQPINSCNITIQDKSSYSCVSLVASTFTIPHPKEVAERTEALLRAADILDTGGSIHGYEAMYHEMTHMPGSMIFFDMNEKLYPQKSLKLLINYITDQLTEDDKSIFDEFTEMNSKGMQYEPVCDQEITQDDLSARWFLFQRGRLHSLHAKFTALKSTISLGGDIQFIVTEQSDPGEYRISVRTPHRSFDISEFCSTYGGGGRQSGAGGFPWHGTLTIQNIQSVSREALTKLRESISHGTGVKSN